MPRNEEIKDRNPVVDPEEAARRWEDLGPEIVSERTINSKVYRVDSENMAAYVYAEPIHYTDDEGKLAEIDNTIVASKEGFTNTAGAAEINFAGQADASPLVEITSGDSQMSFSLQGAAKAVPTTDANNITYPGVRPGVDLLYQVNNRGVKEVL